MAPVGAVCVAGDRKIAFGSRYHFWRTRMGLDDCTGTSRAGMEQNYDVDKVF